MRIALWLLLVVALTGFFSTFVVESGFAGRAVEVQPILPDPHSDTGWRLAGQVDRFIGIPKEAFVTQGAKGIPAQVDLDGLRSDPNVVLLSKATAPIAPARIGAALATASLIFGLAYLRRK